MNLTEQQRLSKAYSGLKDKHVELKYWHWHVNRLLEEAESENAKLRLELVRCREEIGRLERGVAANEHIVKCEAVLSANGLLGQVKAFTSKRYVNWSRYDRLKKERNFYKSLVIREDHHTFKRLKVSEGDHLNQTQ